MSQLLALGGPREAPIKAVVARLSDVGSSLVSKLSATAEWDKVAGRPPILKIESKSRAVR